jgi:hypothetical protein
MTAILHFARNCWVLLLSCLIPGHKFGCDTVHALFFLQNLLACPITYSHLLNNVLNCPTSIMTEELLNSYNRFRSCAACGSPCMFVIVNWCATGLEPGMPMKHLCTTQDSVPKACWIIVRVSVALVPRLAQNLMHTRCSIVKIATGDVHDSKQTRMKTVQILLATCNLTHWLTRHGSPTIYRCFVLPQLLFRCRHQSRLFCIPPRTNYV